MKDGRDRNGRPSLADVNFEIGLVSSKALLTQGLTRVSVQGSETSPTIDDLPTLKANGTGGPVGTGRELFDGEPWLTFEIARGSSRAECGSAGESKTSSLVASAVVRGGSRLSASALNAS